MPAVSSVPVFIEQSNRLLKARPTTTRVTYTYTTDAKTKHGMLAVKTYDPVSGACFRYKTRRAKDLNRIFNSLGPMMGLMAGTAKVDVVDTEAEAVKVAAAAAAGTAPVAAP
ncbi:signal recognition particle 9 kDa protein-domain-containing protein [Dipodascopsis tothii]|uniref:signal recognition particle 9 kDa protein-domain-containing protein n=1 Tax=Dipodascopsis tothii TaxID=44089 RepID=UPI0034CE5DD6